jgi:hypothetical protein
LVTEEAPDNVPLDVDQVTETPAPMMLPFASLTVATRLLVAVPLAVIEDGVATTETTLAVVVSGTRLTTAVPLPAVARAVTVADPAVVPLRLTVARPLLSVTLDDADSEPLSVDQLTARPAPRSLPLASLRVATKVLVAVPLAAMVDGVATTEATLAVETSAIRTTVAFADPATADAVTVADPAAVPFRVTDA